MGFFGRGKKQSGTDPAAALPPLRHVQAEAVEERVLAALVRAGEEGVLIGPDEIRVEGFRLYLDNLRNQLAGLTLADQDIEIDRWVRVMLTSRETSEQTLEDIRATVYPRVIRLAYFGGVPEAAEKAAEAGIRLTSDLVVLPGIDYPDRVGVLTGIDVYGGWDAIWPIAMANLQGLPLPKHTAIPGSGNDPAAGTVHLLETDDFFGASRLLLGESLLAAVLGHPVAAPHGLLLALPNRHMLGVHVITSVAGTAAATVTLAKIARAQLPGPLTDVIHFRAPDGALQPISTTGATGSPQIQVEGAFGDVVAQLMAAEKAGG